MTKEEVVRIAQGLITDFKCESDTMVDFCNTIIKALEQQPCKDWHDVPSDEMTFEQARQAVKDLRKKLAEDLEKNLCGDLISRQAAIDIIESWLSCDDYNKAERDIMRAMQSVLYELPSVKPQQPCEDLINQRANTCRHGGHCEWVACDKCNHYEPKPETITNSTSGYLEVVLPECDDCISRQAVLDFIRSLQRWCVKSEDRKFTNVGLLYDDVMFGIDKLPSVTPKEKTGWIPISERLPEIHQDILLSFRSLDVEVGFRAASEPYFYCNGTYIEPQNVLAWMPLPKPYKAESEGKEDDR